MNSRKMKYQSRMTMASFKKSPKKYLEHIRHMIQLHPKR